MSFTLVRDFCDSGFSCLTNWEKRSFILFQEVARFTVRRLGKGTWYAGLQRVGLGEGNDRDLCIHCLY